MLLDHLLTPELQNRLGTVGDPMLPSNAMVTMAKNYLIACKVEGKSSKTLNTYAMAIERFLQSGQPSDVSGLRLFLLSLQESGLNPYSVHIYYRSLKTFFNWLVTEGFSGTNPMEHIKPPKLPKYVIHPFTLGDIQRMLQLTSGVRFVDLRNRAIVLTFLDTGLRLSEMAAITVPDMDWDRQTIKVMGKGGKERVVRVGSVAQKALLKYLYKRRDDLPVLWVTEERTPLSVAGLQIIIKRLTRQAGITGCKLGPHTFRHTAAINYLRNGGDEFTLQLLLGHATREMTKRYVQTLGTEDVLRVHKKASPVDNLKI